MPRKGRFKNFDETVRRFIMRYGEDALAEAQRRVYELEAEGDAEGAETWRRMTAAIALFLAGPGTGTGQLH